MKSKQESNKKIHLKVITSHDIIVDEMVDGVFSKAIDGEFGVLAGHVPFMTALDICVSKYTQGEKEEYISTIGGIFEIENNEATILSDSAELGEEIDTTRAIKARERAEVRLGTSEKDVDINRAEAALARAMVRLKASKKSH